MFKVIKTILKISRIIVVILIVLNFIPVKFAVQEEDIDYRKEFYIVRFRDKYNSITENWESECYIIGGKNNLYSNTDIPVEVSGKDPQKVVLTFSTRFVIYGTLEQDENNHYILHSDKWQPFGSVSLYAAGSRKALTVYDYNIINRFSELAVIFSYIVIIASVLFALLEKRLKKIKKPLQ